MESYAKKYADLLKEHGYSITSPRKVVFEILYSYGLQSMNQLIHRAKSVDRASIYRVIDILEKIGAINRIPQGFKYKVELSEMFLPHHHHIVCTNCGKQSDIEQTLLEEQLEKLAADNNYILTSHRVELLGTCSTCSDS